MPMYNICRGKSSGAIDVYTSLAQWVWVGYHEIRNTRCVSWDWAVGACSGWQSKFCLCVFEKKRHDLDTDELNAALSLKVQCCWHRNFYTTELYEYVLVVSFMKFPSSLTFLLLLLIIHRLLVDDSDDSLGVLHAIPGIWCPGVGGGKQYGSLKVGGGMREGEEVGGIFFYISGFWPPPWLTELPLMGGRSTQQWSGERKTSACTLFCRPFGELSVLVLWEGLCEGFLVVLITTSPRWNLKKVVRRALRLRSSSGYRFSWSYVSPTLEVCRWRLTTPRAALRCIASILLMFLVVYGSQTLQAYSRTGLTNALYALSLVWIDWIFSVLRRKSRVLLVLLTMFMMWESQRRP